MKASRALPVAILLLVSFSAGTVLAADAPAAKPAVAPAPAAPSAAASAPPATDD